MARIVIDPARTNMRTIRAYKKVGVHQIDRGYSNENTVLRYMLFEILASERCQRAP